MPTVTDSTTLYTRDFRVGDWWARPALNRLEQGAERVQIEPKSMEVLVDLAEHAGEVRSKRRLLHVVWGDAFVTDDVLTHAVWELRKAFGDQAGSPEYIQTIPRKGYRLIAEVEWTPDPAKRIEHDAFHYTDLELLGGGGMGVVYKAWDSKLRRTVALKFLPRELGEDPVAKERFLREARAAARLDHPNIATVFEVGEDPEGHMYISMAFYEGETLKSRIARARSNSEPIALAECLDVAQQIARGLAAAHAQGVIHRDIKPTNVVLGKEGQAKIVDFGLAKLWHSDRSRTHGQSATEMMTVAGSLLGTYPYMSPEQAEGNPVDHRSDLFSFGSLLFELLTGEAPFKGESPAALVSAILKDEPKPPGSLRSDLPEAVTQILGRCLEKDPGDRYESATELADELDALRETLDSGTHLEIAGQAKTPALPAEKLDAAPSRRAARVAALVAAVAVGAGAILLVPKVAHRVFGTPGRAPVRSIAVLPLQNLTGDPDQAYFVDGMHEELIATLAQISAFDKVIARTSVMGFRDSVAPIREIGRQLDVDAVLEGSVRRSEDTVRATVQLIDARTESHLWAESFEHDITDILTLQSEVARAVANAVRVALTRQEEERFASRRPVNGEAYRSYLRGIRLSRWGQTSEDSLEKARGLFETAIEKDPTYAEAYVGLSVTLFQLAHFYRQPGELMPRAYAAALEAVELNDDLSTAHATLGWMKLWWQWDWSGAEGELERALELSPHNETALTRYAELSAAVGQPDKAVSVMTRALELDPLSVSAHRRLGWIYVLTRQFDVGIEHALNTFEVYPDDPMARFWLSWNYMGAGRYAEAAAEIDRVVAAIPSARDNPLVLATLAWAYSNAGRDEEAGDALERLLELGHERYVPPSSVASAYFALGDNERAIEYFERAFESHDTQLFSWVTSAFFDPLHDDPRFQDLLRRMNFPEA